MQITMLFRILGILLVVFSMSMLPPMLVAAWYRDGGGIAFFEVFIITLLVGVWLWWWYRDAHHELRNRDGFLIVALFWVVWCSLGALPFAWTPELNMSWADAVFESTSGLTTTGATVMSGLDHTAHAILYYRAQLHWLGGMGIIVLAVAILPVLGIGGMQLYKAEAPGPVKDDKLTPRIAGTAKALWMVYVGITAACLLAFWLEGMSFFDAVCHAFSALATGGFANYDASLGYYKSPLIEMTAAFFMFVAGTNFALHYFAFRSRSMKAYVQDAEFKFYSAIIIATILFFAAALYLSKTYDGTNALRYAIFHVISIASCTGYAAVAFAEWPFALPVMLIFSACIGGCAGSTGGGMKAIRVLLLCKQGLREIRQLIHPSGIFPIKVNGSSVPDRVISAVWGFFVIYVIAFVVMWLILMMDGLDMLTAFSAVGFCFNNAGVGLGKVSSHYHDIGDISKWTLSIGMLLGRLEIFTLVVLLNPAFWRK